MKYPHTTTYISRIITNNKILLKIQQTIVTLYQIMKYPHTTTYISRIITNNKILLKIQQTIVTL